MKKTLQLIIIIITIQIIPIIAEDIQTDYGEQVHEKGRKSTGTCEQEKLGNTGFAAEYLVSHYTDKADTKPDFVTISVEKLNDHGSTVYFQREFPANKISGTLLKAQTRDIITYNLERNIVYFDLDGQLYSYKIPTSK